MDNGNRQEGEAWVWDTTMGQRVGPPLRHNAPISLAAFSPDGLRVATAYPFGQGAIWEVATGKLIVHLPAQKGNINLAAFSPDGRHVLTVSNRDISASGGRGPGIWEGEARVWDATTGQPVTPPLRRNPSWRTVQFDPSGRRLFTVNQSRAGITWELAPDDRPLEDLLRLAQLLAGRQIDETGAYLPLESDEFRRY